MPDHDLVNVYSLAEFSHRHACKFAQVPFLNQVSSLPPAVRQTAGAATSGKPHYSEMAPYEVKVAYYQAQGSGLSC